MDKAQRNAIHINHLATFMLLLMFAVIRPEGLFPGIGLPVGPLCLLAALVILPLKIHSSMGFANFYKKYRLPIILICLYQLLCSFTLLANLDRYTDLAEFFRWGMVFVAGQMLLPLCIFIFLIPEGTPRLHRPSSVIILALSGLGIALIPTSVLLQVYFPEFAASGIQYFVGGDILAIKAPIRGIFATSTDLGAISGILTFFAAALAAQSFRKSHLKLALFTSCTIVFTLVGALSESRNFVLFIGVATLTVALARNWATNMTFFAAFLPTFATVYYFSAYIMPPALVSKLGAHIPHFENVSKGVETSILDLLPRISYAAFEERGPLWKHAVNLIIEHPIFGVSNGGFRLAQDCSLTSHEYSCRLNTHNILLQSAIDGGLFGTVIITVLLTYIIKKSAHDRWSLAFVLGVIATLMVDNFADHSYAWIVVVSFTGVVLPRLRLYSSGSARSNTSGSQQLAFYR